MENRSPLTRTEVSSKFPANVPCVKRQVGSIQQDLQVHFLYMTLPDPNTMLHSPDGGQNN